MTQAPVVCVHVIFHVLSRAEASSLVCECAALWFFFFFFQAEDGIRDWSVTGVQTCALPIFAEPVLSAGGIIVPPPDYFQRLRMLCTKRGMLLVFDEAQTGFGRLGTMFGLDRKSVV